MRDISESSTHHEGEGNVAILARLRAENETLHELLAVNESTAVEQTRRANLALEEEHRAATARDAQTQLIHDLIHASRDSVMVLDHDYKILFMNGRAQAATANGADVVGKHILEAFPEAAESSFWARYQRVMDTRSPISFEAVYEPLDKWFSMTVAPVGPGIALFYRDITDRRTRDEALARTEKLAAVGRLASSISHEINNPLESVTNLLYLIENTVASPEELRTYAQLASSELARVSHIVTQTLKFHRQSTQAVECRPSEIFESVLALFHSRIVTLHTIVHEDYAAGDLMTCFAGDMRQVFANLIGNALDATGNGGSIWLRTRRAVHPCTGERGIRVTVADNGSGMDPQTQAKIFEAFFTTKGLTGSGLGLWVTEEIIRTHHGSICLRSVTTPGRSGTVFSLFFPA